MNTDEHKKDDGWYSFNGCDYESIEELLQIGYIGFCACGSPDENLEYIRGALEIISTPYPTQKDWDTWWAAHKTKVSEHFGNDRSAYFFYYWADRNGLTEHGSSVPGWLTEKGTAFLTELNKYRTTLEPKDGKNDD